MWVRREKRRGAEWEAVARLNHKPGLLDPRLRVARQVTAASDVRPKSSVGEALIARLPLGVPDYVLVEAPLAAWTDDTEQLRERSLLVRHGAENERGDTGVVGPRLAGEPIGSPVRDRDGDRRLRRRALGALAQIGLGLDSNDFADGRWVVREVRAATASLE